MQCQLEARMNSFSKLLQTSRSGKANDTNATLVEEECPPRIGICACRMLIAVELDRQPRTRAVEVKHIGADRMLPAEGGAELIGTKRMPELPLYGAKPAFEGRAHGPSLRWSGRSASAVWALQRPPPGPKPNTNRPQRFPARGNALTLPLQGGGKLASEAGQAGGVPCSAFDPGLAWEFQRPPPRSATHKCKRADLPLQGEEDYGYR